MRWLARLAVWLQQAREDRVSDRYLASLHLADQGDDEGPVTTRARRIQPERSSASAYTRPIALALLALAGSARAEEPLSLSVLAGSVASLSSLSTGVEPFARLSVDGPVTTLARGPRVAVRLDLSALPGDTVTPEDPRTWRSLELGVSLRQDLPRPLLAQIYAEGGFASRMTGEKAPRVRSPKWAAVGLRLASSQRRAEFRVGVGADQRTGPVWATVLLVGGQVEVRDGVLLLVDSVLGIGHGAGADVHLVRVAFGR